MIWKKKKIWEYPQFSSMLFSDFPLLTNHFGDTPLMETPKSKIPKIATPTILECGKHGFPSVR
jgi:hypothetical protein